METLIKNLTTLLANSGYTPNDETIVAARLHSSNTDSNSYLTIRHCSFTEEYYLVWVYDNNYDLVADLDDGVEDVAQSLPEAKELFKAFFR